MLPQQQAHYATAQVLKTKICFFFRFLVHCYIIQKNSKPVSHFVARPQQEGGTEKVAVM
jgi:hypothetical protein